MNISHDDMSIVSEEFGQLDDTGNSQVVATNKNTAEQVKPDSNVRLPPPDFLKGHLKTLDTGLKFYLIGDEMTSILFWSSAVEVFVFFLAFCLFLTAPSGMALIFLCILHLGRAAVGVIFIFKMPSYRDMIESFSSSCDDKRPVAP